MYAHFHFMSSPRVKPLWQYMTAPPGPFVSEHYVAVEALEPVYAEGRVIEEKGATLHVRASSLYAAVRKRDTYHLEWYGSPNLANVPWGDGPEVDYSALRREQRRVAREARLRAFAPPQWHDTNEG